MGRLTAGQKWLKCGVALAIVACVGEPVVAPIPIQVAALVVVSGGGQRAALGDTLPQPVVVMTRDAESRPLAGVELVFSTRNADGADFTEGKAITGADGVASFRWRVGTPTGDKVLTVRPAGSASTIATSVHATATTPRGALITAGTLSPFGGASLFTKSTVTDFFFGVADASGRGVPGVVISFSTGALGGSVSPARATLGATGTIPVTWTIGADTGTYELIASIDGDTGVITRSIARRVVSGAPAAIQPYRGINQIVQPGAVAATVQVKVTDDRGIGVPEMEVIWTGEGLARPCITRTFTSGVSELTCEWKPGVTPGVHKLSVATGTITGEVTAVIGPAAGSVMFTSPAEGFRAPAGSVLPVQAVVRLADGTPAVGYAVRFTSVTDELQGFSITDARGVAVGSSILPSAGPTSISVYMETGYYPTARLTGYATGRVPYSAISAGAAHTCAVAADFRTTSRVYCWGRNSSGQLGNGSTTPQLLPKPTADPPSGFSSPIAIVTAGAAHTCVTDMYTSGGPNHTQYVPSAICWGSNAAGEVGNVMGVLTRPQRVTNSSFGNVSAGFTHTCAFYTCWGDNSRGALGDGTTRGGAAGTAILYPNSVIIGHVTAGNGFTCAMTTVGRIYCWGRNEDGQAGNGTRTDQLAPVLLAGSFSYDPSGRVTAGDGHTCALRTDGQAVCWGRNDQGQLGDGTTVTRTEPVLVAGGIAFKAISAGGQHTCALTVSGSAYCWGANEAGQLGVGTVGTRVTSPQLVAGGLSFASLSAGFGHSCGLLKSAALQSLAYCWGLNADGQVGDGTTINRATPVPVAEYQP